MPNKPRLTWVGPNYMNGRRGWAAVLDGHSFMVVQTEDDGGFTASAMNMANVDHEYPRDFRPDPNKPGGMLAAMKPPDLLKPGHKHRPVMLGGSVDGAVFPSLQDAQAACETYARGVRRGLNS
jgi:hypothetical protein